VPDENLYGVGFGGAVDTYDHHRLTWVQPFVGLDDGIEFRLVDGWNAVLRRPSGLNFVQVHEGVVEVRVRPLQGHGQLGVDQILDEPPADTDQQGNADDSHWPGFGKK